jgi:hypothetical protein
MCALDVAFSCSKYPVNFGIGNSVLPKSGLKSETAMFLQLVQFVRRIGRNVQRAQFHV